MVTLAVTGAVALHLRAGAALAAQQRVLHDTVLRTSVAWGLRVEQVTSRGQQRTSAEELQGIVENLAGVSLLSVDLAQLRGALQALPWVAHAEIRRVWPDRLTIQVTERTPLVVYQGEDGGNVVIDTTGAPIDAVDAAAFTDRLLVHGAGALDALDGLLTDLARAPHTAERVVAASYIGARRWDLYWGDARAPLQVMLPEHRRATALARLERYLQQPQTARLALRWIDLRLPDQPVARLTAEAAALLEEDDA